MNLDDISLDCESLSTKYDAPIISIGAVSFNRTTGKLGLTFYEEIAIDSAVKHGRVQADTLQWWLTQDSKVRNIFRTPDSQKMSLATVLQNFSTWCRSIGSTGVPRVWANGPATDVTWIEHAMHVGGHGLQVPWGFRNVRCMRTIVELAEELTGFQKDNVPNVGTAHTALDDAKYQANVISAAYAALKRTGKIAIPHTAIGGKKLRDVLIDDEL